jgi:hypothetical protein
MGGAVRRRGPPAVAFTVRLKAPFDEAQGGLRLPKAGHYARGVRTFVMIHRPATFSIVTTSVC